jgi:hypothetical protein
MRLAKHIRELDTDAPRNKRDESEGHPRIIGVPFPVAQRRAVALPEDSISASERDQ